MLRPLCASGFFRYCTVSENLSDAALLLVGHGSTVNASSAAPVCLHAGALRRRGLFAQVREAFWKQEPYVRQVLRGLSAPRVFIVPIFVSEGYFTGEVIPRELGFCCQGETRFPRVRQHGGQTLHYCGPVGTHPAMTDVLLARARGIVQTFPFPRAPRPSDTALFIAGHGTTRNEDSRKAIEQQADFIRGRRLYAEVHAVFMEEDPRIGDCCRLARARNIVMVPFFISDGQHVCQDIPVMLGVPGRDARERLKQGQPAWRNPTERDGKRIWYTAAIGGEPSLAGVILARVREASAA